MALFSRLRRRWPEAALIVVLAVAAAYSGLALRSLAIVLLGCVVLYAIRRRFGDVVRGALLTVGLLVATIAVTFTIDLGQLFGGAIKAYAEREGTRYLERPLHIGRLGIQIARGRFVVEDLRIDGVRSADAPFFAAGRILIAFPWWRVIRTREFFVESIEMSDWTMQVEKFANGNNVPKLKPKSETAPGPKRFTTTLQYVHAYRGRFTYLDHGTWSTVARNLDLYVRHDTGEYLGTATITDGTVKIKDYLPMRSDMRVKFRVEGPVVKLPEIVLFTDGARSDVTGEVDFGHWPNMIYHVDSRIDLWRMREIFFATESWRSRGDTRFKGTFRLFDGGHELKGDFTSALAHVNVFAFSDLRGSLIWEPHRFEVTRATARFYDGAAKFRYAIAPLSDPRPAVARWDVTYEDVDLTPFSDAVGLRGLVLVGRASGRNLLEWPLGRFSEHRGDGRVVVAPPADRVLLGRTASPGEAAIHAEPPPIGPDPDVNRYPRPTPIGGEFTYRYGSEWFEVDPSTLATERTYVEFEGRTAYGDRSQFPFHARSADWQESDRLLAGIITAVGSPTGIIRVGGHGDFRGTMTGAFRDPLIVGDFTGDDIRGWDVVWGRTTGRLTIQNGYVDITRGVVTRSGSEIRADGRFSLGYPRRDGGEEINARFELKDRDMRDLRHAFQLDDWPLDGKVSGEFRLYDKYTRPWGYGRLAITRATAWGEGFELATAPLRFEGTGVRIDAADIRKSGGAITGAAYVGWDGRYSFNADGQRIPMESVAAVKYGQTGWSGLLRFSAAGASTFKNPRYEAKLSVDDLFIGEEGIGAVVIRMSVRDRLVTIHQLEAAGLGVSGSGQIEMAASVDSELTLRFTNTLLDPYVRLFEPRLSPYTRAVASGTVHVVGQLANLDRVFASATIEELNLKLFDYELQNDGPIRLTFENNAIRVVGPPGDVPRPGDEPKLRMVGDGTRLELSGGVGLKENRIGITLAGDANLAIMQAFSREIRSSGRAILKAEINGPLNRPEFSGEARLIDGRIRHSSMPQSIQAINGRITFGAEGIGVDGLTAQIAGGKVRFGGGVEMNGYTIGRLGLTATAEKMEFRYPEGFRSLIDAQLDLVGTLAAPTLRGTVTVRNALYNRRVDIIPGLLELAGARPDSGAGGGAASSSLPLRFDIRIQAASSIRVESNFAHILASADLVLRGTYDHPVLFGRAEIERGEAIIEGKRYMVRHGTFDFNNPTKIEPFLNVEAETLVRVPGQTYIVNAQLVGTIDRMKPQLTSDPPLSEIEIFSLLFGGDTARAIAGDAELRTLQREESQRTLATSRATQAAVGVVSLPVTRAVEQAFGLDTFQITPNVGYDPYQRLTPTARLTVGKRISNRVYLTFSRSLNTPGGADQVILLEYDQNDRLSWIFSRNEDGTYALDVRVRHVF